MKIGSKFCFNWESFDRNHCRTCSQKTIRRNSSEFQTEDSAFSGTQIKIMLVDKLKQVRVDRRKVQIDSLSDLFNGDD